MIRTTPARRKLYIDALSLVPTKKSGIGQTVESTLKALSGNEEFKRDWQAYLLAPLGKAKALRAYTGPNIKVRRIYLPARVVSLWSRLNFLPPIDIFIGRGTYLFPNYSNWPLMLSRSITYIYDASFFLVPETVKPKNQKYLSRHVARWIRRSSQVVTISRQVGKELTQLVNVDAKKLRVIYCGVDTKLFYRRQSAEIDAVKREYSIRYEKYILFVSTIEPRKGLDTLLDAYTALSEEVQYEYGLVIIGGNGWLNQDILARIDQLKKDGTSVLKVSKYVETSDLPAIYSGATVLVHPAIYEGFGITPLESLACGTHVIASDIPVLREVFQDQITYFTPRDSDELAAKLQAELTSKHGGKDIGIDAGSASLIKRFSWDEAARQLLSVMDKVSSSSGMDRTVSPKRRLREIDSYILSRLNPATQKGRLQNGRDKNELIMNIYDSMLIKGHTSKRILLKIYTASRRIARRIKR